MTIILSMHDYRKRRLPPPALLDALGRGGIRQEHLSRVLTARQGRKENPGLSEDLPRVEVGQGRRRFVTRFRAAAERGRACVAAWVPRDGWEWSAVIFGASAAVSLAYAITEYGERIEAAMWGVR